MSGDSIRTMEEFSQFVGLSRPTVSRYFHDNDSVRASTRKRIEHAIDRCGYRPNLLAVNLNRRQSSILGVVVPSLFDPFYMAITRRIDQIASTRGFTMFTLSSDGKPEQEAEAIRTFTSMNVAGSIIAPLGRRSRRSHLRDIKQSMPLVAIDSPLDTETTFVGTNNSQSMHLIVDYLCRSGEPPVYFDMPGINDNAFERRQAYIDSMQTLGHTPVFAHASDSGTWDFEHFAFEQTNAIFSAGQFKSNTVLCANDRLAFGVLAACYKIGVTIGRSDTADLRVAGHDNQPLSAYCCPPLTTVSQNYDAIGRIAAEALFAKLGESDLPDEISNNQVLLKAELVLRDSA